MRSCKLTPKAENEVVQLKCNEGAKTDVKFLIDSGSQISMIKLSSVKKGTKFDPSGRIRIKGITKEVVETIGTVLLHLQVGKLQIVHKFQLMGEGIDIPYDGLIGNDLWKQQKAIVDYEKHKVFIKGKQIPILTLEEPKSCTLVGRSEQIIRMRVASTHLTEGLVCRQELLPGVYLPDAVVKVRNGICWTSVVNTTEQDIDVKLPIVVVEELQHTNNLAHVRNTTVEESKECHSNLKSRIELLETNLRINDLNKEEHESLLELCTDYNDIFHLPGDTLTQTHAREYQIKLRDEHKHSVVNARPYKLAESQKHIVKELTDKMLKDNIIEQCDSEWSSPMLLIPKKIDASGKQKWRVVIDYRLLNSQCVGNSYPLPLINDILESLGKAKYFSSLDLASGYFQCPLREEDRPMTAFSTPFNHFQFKVLPMGLKGACEYFQKLMNTVLCGIQGLKSFAYLDDIVCHGSTLESHNANLKDVFDRLRKFNLKLQPDKCEFLRREILYLGHHISENGVSPDPSKVECVQNYPRPLDVKQLRRYLGLTSYYRKFVPNFGKIAKPLYELLLKDATYTWGPRQELAFCELKEKLISKPLLQYPDFEREFLLTTDASGTAIGAVLSQGEIGKDLPIAYASRSLNKAERNYSASELEMLSVVYGVQYFRQYLYGRRFRVVTDHRPLCWAFKMHNPSSRLTRWRLKLEEYEYEIVYKPGVLNSNADALSRIRRVETRQSSKQNSSNEGTVENDEMAGKEIEQLEKYEPLENTDSRSLDTTNYQETEPEDGNSLSREDRMAIIKEYHNTPFGGHVGAHRTYERLKPYIRWTNMQGEIENFIRSCPKCQVNKITRKNTKMPMKITNTPSSVFESCSIDICGPITVSDDNNKYILTFQDDLSKFVIAIPMATQDASTVAKAFVEHVVLKYGVPGSLLSDRGANFLSDIFKQTCRLLNITKIHTCAFRPESNGSNERNHRVLTEYLRHFISESQTDWDKWINYATFVYNTTPHVGTKYSPFEMLYGRRVNLPGRLQRKPEQHIYNPDDVVKELKIKLQACAQIARENLIHAKNVSKRYYDRTQNTVDFRVKDKVLLYDESLRRGRSRKLCSTWTGPFEIVRVDTPNVIIKVKKNRVQKVHSNRLKLFF